MLPKHHRTSQSRYDEHEPKPRPRPNIPTKQYLRARYYDPATGRFNRLDPFAGNNQDPQSLHKYLYAHANPVMGVDPSGREFSLAGLGQSIGIGATLGGIGGAAIGRVHGGIKGGFQGAATGAFNGLLSGAAIGAFIGGGGYALGSYFISLGVPVAEAYGAATSVASTPFRGGALVSFFHPGFISRLSTSLPFGSEVNRKYVEFKRSLLAGY